MRRELNTQEIRNMLSSQALGRLACSNGKQPYIVPVTYTYDGHYIYGQTNEGKKLRMLRRNPNVCFETDIMTDMRNWKTVLVYGTFEELKDEEEKRSRDILYGNIFELMTSSTVHNHEHGTSAEIDDSNRVKTVMYRIRIKRMTGQYEKQ